jgi:hypothetical protein
MFFSRKPKDLPTADQALPGRAQPLRTAETHFVNGRPLKGPYPKGWSLHSSAWAVSGALSGSSGSCRACT